MMSFLSSSCCVHVNSLHFFVQGFSLRFGMDKRRSLGDLVRRTWRIWKTEHIELLGLTTVNRTFDLSVIRIVSHIFVNFLCGCRLCYREKSFWKRSNRIGKAKRKLLLLYYILPTQIRDKIPAVRTAIHKFVWSLRRLDGQVHSYEKAVSLGILPGSRVMDPTIAAKAGHDLIQSLVLLEGCLPVSHLKPSMHHFVHYGEYTESHGCLRWFWMMFFERFNLLMKTLVCLCRLILFVISTAHLSF